MYGYFTERNYNLKDAYTDLAIERPRAKTDVPGIDYEKDSISGFTRERVKISTKSGAESLGRPIGIYDSLSGERIDRLDNGARDRLTDALAAMLCRMLEECDIFPGRLLVAGLGNSALTPDALGCEAAGRVRATMHIKELDPSAFRRLGCAEIAVIKPGVAAESGLDAAVMLKGVADLIRPDAILAIDSLATSSEARLGATLQIASSGISPGSGVGNPRIALCPETVGVPVISVGLATVIDSRLICRPERRPGEVMLVAPREINDVVSSAAEVIGGAINRAVGIYF